MRNLIIITYYHLCLFTAADVDSGHQLKDLTDNIRAGIYFS